MRSRMSPTSRIIIRIWKWATTTAACSLRRTRSADSPRTTSSARRRSIGLRCPRRLRQLPAEPERPRHEEALELGAAIDPAEAALRELRQRSGAVREQPIEGVDGDAHELGLALAPALVAPQHPQRPRILALVAGRADELRERRRIEQSEIDALSCERMDHMRGIPDERAALGDIALRVQALQRK